MAKKKPSVSAVQKPVAAKQSSAQPNATRTENGLKWLLAVLAITFVLYIPSLSNQYVNWDDDPNITENPNLTTLTSRTLPDIFSLEKGTVIGNYNPLPIATFALEKKLFGKLDPRITHWGNLLLHLACVALAFFLLRQMQIGSIGSAFGALLFGIHPMRVESVAWATERKDVLFGVFFFAALIYYVKWMHNSEGKTKYYVLALLMAVLSLFSKVQAVALPLAMLTLDYWFKRPISFKLILEKAPFWVLSLIFGLINVYTLGQNKSLDDITNYSFPQRMVIGMYSFCVYLYKLVIPYPMAPMYPYPKVFPNYFYVAPLVFIGFWWLIWKLYKSEKATAWVFAALFFMFNVMFVLQVVGAGQGYLADRFTYIPYFGIFAAVAYFVDRSLRENRHTSLIYGLGAAFFLMCAVMTVKQIGIWQNGETLWTHVMKFEGKTIALPWGNRAHYYRGVGQFDKSLKDYNEAISISPEKPDFYNSRGKTYFDMAMSGKYGNQTNDLIQKALQDYTKGISLNGTVPKNVAELHVNRGAAYGASGQYEKALEDLAMGEKIDSTNKNVYLNRSLVNFNMQRFDKAIEDHTNILRFEPYNANIYYERGMCNRILSKNQDAINDLSRSIELQPDLGLAYVERARAYVALNNMSLAKADIQKALQLKANVDPQLRAQVGL